MGPVSVHRFGIEQQAQVAERLCVVKAAIARFECNACPFLDGRGQLHAAQAVEVQVFGDPQLVSHARRRFAGDLRNHCQEPVCGSPQGVRCVAIRRMPVGRLAVG